MTMRETIHEGEVLGEAALSMEDVARLCGVQVAWVHEHVLAGVLRTAGQGGEWRFDSATLVRARRVARLESDFAADPQLAALAADLMEEVARLRRRLLMLEDGEAGH
ncbi:chaperone modulator CbpM [Ramlibacter tataouinensis]|uniref:chaperone modulator CbpM n=1 Tax=Ramlibacter tataouinensis TaxID=94132 RepID=UPI0022F3BE0E|nr:chaperone modulator CbpM [Ramlibacter tataouinensis]WBY03329.1 chaperone modulator CbpM [Ramlibacter tataouinensis]